MERHYPSFVDVTSGQAGVRMEINSGDVRARIVKRDQAIDLKRRIAAGEKVPAKEDETWPWEIFAFVGGVMAVVVALAAFVVWIVITYFSD